MSKYETLNYDVVLKEDNYEIRKYSDFFIVEYENIDENTSGFRALFKYISNDNKENKKIAMTTPVIQEMIDENKKIAFVLPDKYFNQIPEPNNPDLRVKKFDQGLFGVIQYSGFSNKRKELEMMEKLEGWILKNFYIKKSNYMLASYNAPFMPPMFRRNEIWIRVIEGE